MNKEGQVSVPRKEIEQLTDYSSVPNRVRIVNWATTEQPAPTARDPNRTVQVETPETPQNIAKAILSMAPDTFFAVGEERALWAFYDGGVEPVTPESLVGILSEISGVAPWFKGGFGVNREDVIEYLARKVARFDYASSTVLPYEVQDETHFVNVYDKPYSKEMTGKLDELVDRFEWGQDLTDRIRVKAAIMTPFWHCAGQVPFFSIEGEGQGTGKTVFVQMIMYLHMGHIIEGVDTTIFRAKDPNTELSTQLGRMIENGQMPPIMLIDDVNSLFRSERFRSLITSTKVAIREIYGKPRHVPNHVVWFLTGNTMSYTSDELSRVFPVKLYRPRLYNPTWVIETKRFIDRYREDIISDIRNTIKAGGGYHPYMGRWEPWSKAILGPLCPNTQTRDLLEMKINGAKVSVNDAVDQADEYYSILMQGLVQAGLNVERDGVVFIPKTMLRDISPRQYSLATAIQALSRSGDLSWLLSDDFLKGSSYPGGHAKYRARGIFVVLGKPYREDIVSVQCFRQAATLTEQITGKWKVGELSTYKLDEITKQLPSRPSISLDSPPEAIEAFEKILKKPPTEAFKTDEPVQEDLGLAYDAEAMP